MSARFRPSSCPAQAQTPQASLLHGRGDLLGTRATFEAQLPKPSPTVLPKRDGSCISRVGMELKRDTCRQRLLVNDIDDHPRRRTPAAQWNLAEERQKIRGDSERHQSFAIMPGDRIRAVNDVGTNSGMLEELEQAMSSTSPKAVNLKMSRDITDVLRPISVASLPEIVSPPRDTRTSMRPPRPINTPPRSSSSSRRGSTASASSKASSPPLSHREHGLFEVLDAVTFKKERSASKDSAASTRSPSMSGGSTRSHSVASSRSAPRHELLGASSRWVLGQAGRSMFC